MHRARELVKKQKSYLVLSATLTHLEKINQQDSTDHPVQTPGQLWSKAAWAALMAVLSGACHLLWNQPITCKPHLQTSPAIWKQVKTFR